jgi:hypothetical protein
MDGYLVILCLGFGGLLLMLLVGLTHAGGSHGHAHAHSGHGHHGLPASGAHGAAGRGASFKVRGGPSARGSRFTGFLASLISPVVIFSWLLGFGAAGVLLRPFAAHWPVFLLPVVAAIDAGLFERYLVQPFWTLLFGFASAPAKTLDSLVRAEGRAATNFDASGHGLIVVELDGQVRQLLGALDAEERIGYERVRSGDRLVIRAVDPLRNSCTVSRLN